MTGPATAVMWEARAAEGRGADLLAWARGRVLPGGPSRRETLTAPGGRVLVITWWPPGTDPAELPDPPAGLTARPVHRWRFSSVDVTGN